jgi:SWI/SNF-related matrix-associated actin-dependent regulator of chromatin subfamily A containing DEAD/H box 1
MHDLDFNPFNDLQAEDRCHRIGQKKSVTVYKMVTEGTVDADIYEMQQRKARMNAAILESSQEKAKKKTEEADVSNILLSAVNRFLLSPEPKGGKGR